MNLKKIFVCITMCLLFCGLAGVGETITETRITDIRYRCRIESTNPLWHLLFSIFVPDSQDFFWREKTDRGDKGVFREISISNKSREVAKFFSCNGDFGAKINLGGRYGSKELDASQAKVWFNIRDFTRLAKQGDVYKGIYQTPENAYQFLIEAKARQELMISDSGQTITALYFEGIVFRQQEKFLEINFWVAEDKNLKGQVVKCSFKRTFWPIFIIEIIDDVN